jgi:hypothetical protein
MKVSRGPALLLILVSSSYFGFHVWNDGYRSGAGGTMASYLLLLWVSCWLVSSTTRDGAFVRWVMLTAALFVVPTAAVGFWLASQIMGLLLNLALLVGAPLVAGVYHVACSSCR